LSDTKIARGLRFYGPQTICGSATDLMSYRDARWDFPIGSQSFTISPYIGEIQRYYLNATSDSISRDREHTTARALVWKATEKRNPGAPRDRLCQLPKQLTSAGLSGACESASGRGRRERARREARSGTGWSERDVDRGSGTAGEEPADFITADLPYALRY